MRNLGKPQHDSIMSGPKKRRSDRWEEFITGLLVFVGFSAWSIGLVALLLIISAIHR